MSKLAAVTRHVARKAVDAHKYALCRTIAKAEEALRKANFDYNVACQAEEAAFSKTLEAVRNRDAVKAAVDAEFELLP